MQSSISVVFSSFFLCAGLILLLTLCLRMRTFYDLFNLKVLYIIVWLITLRQFLPLEFLKFTVTIYSEKIMTRVRDFWGYSFSLANGYSLKVSTIIIAIWMVGMICYDIRLIRSAYRLANIRKAPCLQSGRVFNLSQQIRKEMKISGDISVIQNNYIKTPAIVGICKPVILLPKYDFTERELRQIFIHEYAHCQHKDNLLKMLLEVLNSICWWNPLFYLLKAQISTIFEFRADYEVLNKGISPKEYMMCLCDTYKRCCEKNDANFIAAFCATSDSEIVKRFQYIASMREKRNSKYGKGLCAFIGVILIVLSYSITFEASYPIPQDILANTIPFDEKTMYLKQSKQGAYYLYYNNKCLGVVNNIDDPPTNSLKKYKYMED